MGEWFDTSMTGVAAAAISITAIYLGVLIATRIGGLRSLSKMSSFDFATTVAVGTLVASTGLSADPPLFRAFAAVALIYLLQFGVARLRYRSARLAHLLENQPLLLVRDGHILRENLKRVNMTEAELHSQMRLAGVGSVSQVRAAVMETTGDVSVVQAPTELDPAIMQGVRR